MLKERIPKAALRLAGWICAVAMLAGSAAEASAEEKAAYEDIPYQELFTQGKEWTWYHIMVKPDIDNGTVRYETHWIINVKVDGSKEIDGIGCKRLEISLEKVGQNSCSTCDSWLDHSLLSGLADQYDFKLGIPEEVYVCEKDRKIYFYRNPGLHYDPKSGLLGSCDPYFDLLMDLNITVGDKIPSIGKIKSDNIVNINGKPHRCLSAGQTKINEKGRLADGEWIEGIGASIGQSMYETYYDKYGFHYAETGMPYFLLADCKEDGVTIFDQSELLKDLGVYVTNGIPDVEEQHCHPRGCYDLQGRPVETPAHGQLYIQDGKIRLIL